MTRFSAIPLDLSRFPPPVAIRGVDFDTLRLNGLSLLKQAFTQYGIDWDVETLEANPGAIINRAITYREFLAYVRINDAVRAVMIAFAIGTDLDHLGAFYGTLRRVIAPASGGAPAVMEGDAEFRNRILLAPEAFTTGGAAGAYAYHALSSDPDVLNVDVWTPFEGSGQVIIAVQSRHGDGIAPPDLVERVHAYMHRVGPNGWPCIKPLTTTLSTRSIVNIPYQIDVEGFVLFGPDPSTAKEDVRTSLAAMAASRRVPSRDVPLSALFAAGAVGPIDKLVVRSPVSDIARGFGEVAFCTGINVEVTSYAG